MATMADVARHAGVSLSTVSYVLSGKRTISEATRERVLDAIAATNFTPNARGQALASRRSRTLILLFPALAGDLGQTNMEFVQGCLAVAREHGYGVMVSISDDPYEETERAARHGFADGVILMEVDVDDRRVDLLQARGFPFAMIGHQDDNTGLDFVDLDFAHAAELCLDHLAALGHREVALVLPVRRHHGAGYGPAVRSRRGFEGGLASRGLTGAVYQAPSSAAGGYETVRRALAEQPGLTAMVSTSPELVPGMQRAASEAGLRVPDAFSIVTLASVAVAEAAAPPLSAVDFPAEVMGRTGTEMLIRRLEFPEAAPDHRLLRGTFTPRGTSGPVRPRPGHDLPP